MPTPKKKGESGRTCGGCLIAVGVLIVLAIIGSAMRGGSDDTKTTGSVTKTAQSSPTTPTFSAAEKKYVSDIGSDGTTVGKALTSVREEAQNYTGSASQQARLVVAMATIKATWGSWKDRSAPAARWKVVHRHWLAALRDLDKSVTLLARGIDHNNVSYVTKAAHYMNTGGRQAELATASMQTIKATLGL